MSSAGLKQEQLKELLLQAPASHLQAGLNIREPGKEPKGKLQHVNEVCVFSQG